MTLSASRNQDSKRQSLSALLKEVRGCEICSGHLPLGPRPVVRAHKNARLLIIGQAPGTRVHESAGAPDRRRPHPVAGSHVRRALGAPGANGALGTPGVGHGGAQGSQPASSQPKRRDKILGKIQKTKRADISNWSSSFPAGDPFQKSQDMKGGSDSPRQKGAAPSALLQTKSGQDVLRTSCRCHGR